MPQDRIIVRGAREHNLKNIDVIIPRDQLVVITGLSGSGKSSLAFDTIFAEGQRRYVESLSAYARQFLGQMEKPDVDHIDGLSPAISIDQKSTSHNPRSTVGTVTEIYDYMRLLYARVGRPHCPNCGREVSQQTVEQIVDAVLALPESTRIMLMAPVVRGRKGEYRQVFEDMRRAGYVRVRVDGQVRDLSEEIELEKYQQHTIEVIIDRLIVRHASRTIPTGGQEEALNGRRATDERLVAEQPERYTDDRAPSLADAVAAIDTGFRQRVADSVETALKLGNGIILVAIVGGAERMYSERFACVYCGISLEEIAPRTFSFNNPHGACPECTGLGTKLEVDADLVVTNPNLSIAEGAILPWTKFAGGSQWYTLLLEAVARHYGFSLHVPFKRLEPEYRQIILYGSTDEVSFSYTNKQGVKRQHRATFEGVIPNLERRYREASEGMRAEFEQYMSARPCPVCHGARLKPESLAVTVGGYNIVAVTHLSIVQAEQFFTALVGGVDRTPPPGDSGYDPGPQGPGHEQGAIPALKGQGTNGVRQATSPLPAQGRGAEGLGPRPDEPVYEEYGRDYWQRPVDLAAVIPLTERERYIARQILKEIRARLGFLVNVGLDYLSLDRAAMTLSGGEAQRIRLATQIGSGLMGVLYILDEPSIGLHQRDNRRLIDTLLRLRDLGNTLLVVEHDEETMRSADHVIDIGPGAGEHGGRIVAEGTIEQIIANPNSLTGDFLAGRRQIPLPAVRRPGNGLQVTVRGARENNLKDIDVAFPLGKFIVVTGVSGSGKSSLINEILYKRISQELYRSHARPGQHDNIEGLEHLDKIIAIDQSPIGRTPRSNPATYTGAFTPIREIFAQVPEARLRGYQPGRFSFNVKGGRCEACRGEGIIQIEMHFLPDVYVACEVCKGKRYNREALEIHYKGKTIADVLDMTVEEALDFFGPIPAIANKLATLNDVGLGYIHLGQPATTLSGGEAQRIKLAAELSRRATGRTLYILDEPTTGLHFADVERLLQVLQRLVDAGNTVIVIEHNLDVIKSADWIIDLGPEGGDRGGWLLAEGTPEEVAIVPQSYTGQFLQRLLRTPVAR
jgi:excinuclease ABC subunit A